MAAADNQDCCICLEKLSIKARYTLTCAHTFHRECISRWLETNNTCPYCRTPVEPAQRYVDDHIISAQRLLMLRIGCTIGANILERMFPNHLEGLARHASNSTSYNQMWNDLMDPFGGTERAIYTGVSGVVNQITENARRAGKTPDEYIKEMCDDFKKRTSTEKK